MNWVGHWPEGARWGYTDLRCSMISYDMLVSIVALSAITTGMAAPEFEAVSHDGRKITLSELRQKGPVMLVFLRGFS